MGFLGPSVAVGALRHKGGYDQDAQLLFTETESVGGYIPVVHKIAISAYFTGLKAEGVFTKAHVIKWFLGGKSASAALNWVDPEDNNGFNTVWQGEMLKDKYFNKYGVEATGNAADRGHEGFIPKTDLTDPLKMAMFWGTHNDAYIGTNSVLFGSTGTGSFVSDVTINGAGEIRSRLGDNPSNTITTSLPNTFGNWYSNRKNDSSHKLFKNDVLQDTDTSTITDNSDAEFYLLCKNDGGPSQPTGAGVILTHYCVFDGLTDAEAAAVSGLNETLVIALGKYVQPELYAYYHSLSSDDHKFIEATTYAWEDVSMTTAIWAKVVAFVPYAPNSSADSLIDMKGNFNGTLVNSPVQYSYGYTYDTGNAINSGITLGSDINGQFGFGCYLRDSPLSTNYNQYLMGTGGIYLRFRSNNALRAYYGGGIVDWDTTGVEDERLGVLGCNRDTSNNVDVIVNGEVKVSDTDTTTNIDSAPAYIGARNDDPGVGIPIDANYPMGGYFYTEQTSRAEYLVVAAYLEAIMKRRGISVVSSSEDESTSNESNTYLKDLVDDSSVNIASQEEKAKVKMIQEYVNSGIWAEADTINVYATIEQSDANLLHDLKNALGYSPLLLNTPARDIEGMEGSGSEYHNISFAPSTDGINFGQDDHSISFKITKAPTAVSDYLYGCQTAIGATRTRFETGASVQRVNSGSSTQLQISGLLLADLIGNMFIKKISSTEISAYLNNVLVGNEDALADSNIGNAVMCVLAHNNNGSITGHTDAKLANFLMGSSSISEAVSKTIEDNYLLRLKGWDIPLAA